MPTDPAPEKVAAHVPGAASDGTFSWVECSCRWNAEGNERETWTQHINAAGYDVARIEEGERRARESELAVGIRRVKDIERRGYNPPYAALVMNDPDAGL